MRHTEDLTGRTFGRLTALRCVGTSAGRARWECVCDCGTRKIMRADHLRSYWSCGCSRRKPGGSNELKPEYKVWLCMRQRCNRVRNKDYPRYGGRGIRVCDRWDSFDNFYADMGPRPSDDHSIDRIDNDGNYEPGNCRWATRSQQQLNKRRRAA